MIPPGLRPAAPAAWPAVLILGNSGCGIRLTGKPPCLHLPHAVDERLGFLRSGCGIGLRLLLGQLTRMPHDKAPEHLRHASVTVFHLHLAAYALAVPPAGLLGLRPPGLLDQEGQRRLLAPPRFQLLPDGTGARDERHAAHAAFKAQPQGPTTLGLTIPYNPAHACPAQGPTLLNRQGCFHPITPMAITHTAAPRYAAIPTHAEAQQHLFEIVPSIFAMPVGRVRGLRTLGLVLICPLECNGRRILMEPWGRDSIDLQGFKRQGAKDRVKICGKQGIKDVPETVIVERRTCQPRLQQWQPPSLFEPSPHLILKSDG